MKEIKLDRLAAKPKAAKEVLETNQEPSIWERDIRFGPAIPMKERQKLYQLLGILLGSGLGIMDAIEVLKDQVQSKKLKEILDKVEVSLEDGVSLSDSLESQADYFSPFEIYTLRMGEQSGRMAEILHNLADFYDKRVRLRRKLVQAFSYPIAVIFIAALVLTFMIAFVVPMFEDIFSRFEADLPPITQSILSISEFMQLNYPWILLGIAALGGIWYGLRKNETYRACSARASMKIPLLGKLIHKLQLARFSYTFGLLLKAKVNLDRSLELLTNVTPFYPLQKAVGEVRTDVIGGQSLYEASIKHKIFPKFFTQIVKVGEKTAKLDHMMEKLAESLEEESEAGISQLTQFLEPLLIIILGVMVAIILVAMYLPMFELSNAIG